MHFCDLTLGSPAENLACDEALLDLAEKGQTGEILRVWEPGEYFVVLGYGNKARSEVDLSSCLEKQIPVLRRCTGGGTVLQGPGTLNYALILRIAASSPCYSIDAANKFIMGRHRAVLSRLLDRPVEISGCSDLSIRGLKFSGNAQRRKKDYLLFHGSFLLNLDFDLMESVLPLPSKTPDYRAGRSHRDFLMNLNGPSATIKTGLRTAWSASTTMAAVPQGEIESLVQEKYCTEAWNLRF